MLWAQAHGMVEPGGTSAGDRSSRAAATHMQQTPGQPQASPRPAPRTASASRPAGTCRHVSSAYASNFCGQQGRQAGARQVRCRGWAGRAGGMAQVGAARELRRWRPGQCHCSMCLPSCCAPQIEQPAPTYLQLRVHLAPHAQLQRRRALQGSGRRPSDQCARCPSAGRMEWCCSRQAGRQAPSRPAPTPSPAPLGTPSAHRGSAPGAAAAGPPPAHQSPPCSKSAPAVRARQREQGWRARSGNSTRQGTGRHVAAERRQRPSATHRIVQVVHKRARVQVEPARRGGSLDCDRRRTWLRRLLLLLLHRHRRRQRLRSAGAAGVGRS